MRRTLFIILTLVLIGSLYPISIRYSQSFKFVDEDEHMVVGWLLTQRKQLYTDVSTNHQPLNYLTSAAVHQISRPQNLFMLIQRHRQAVFLWSLIWTALLVWRFGGIALFPITIFELIKYWLLGNLFLAESFAVYPTAYIFCASWQEWMHDIVWNDEWMWGICLVLATLFSLPLAIPLGILVLVRLCHKLTKISFVRFFAGFVVAIVPIFIIVPFTSWWMETIVYNAQYGVPLLSEFTSILDWIRLWTLPFWAFIPPYDNLSVLQLGMGLIWVSSLLVLLVQRQWRHALFVIGFFFVWGMTNLRVIQLHQYYYSGFHLIPWLLTGLLLTWFLFHFISIRFLTKKLQVISYGIVIVGLGIWLTQPTMPYRQLPNPQTESYIQYTPQFQVSEVILTLQNPGDTLMTVPNETLPYWLTKLTPATRQVTYYEWQYRNPLLQQQWQAAMQQRPPRFITYLDEGATFTPFIQQQLQQSYVKLFDFPLVYIRKDSLAFVTEVQRQNFLQLAQSHSGINTDVFNTK